MQPTRNRLAQSASNGRSARKGRASRQDAPPPSPRHAREDVALMLRQGAEAPPGFPADQIVPAHRGAVITAASWPATALVVPADHAPPPVRPISRKAAKKAARLAAARERAKHHASPAQHHASRAAEDLLILATPAEPGLAEPISPPDSTLPIVRIEPECAPALALPPEPEPHAHRPSPVEVAPSPEVPLPTARALVPRRQGFVDVLAFMLRDSGRRLSRWSSAKRRADDMKEKLAKAEARMRAMEAQLAALQDLQRRVRQS